jgi:hypothetical protein
MIKVFLLLFVSFCFGFMGLVLWVGSAHALPPPLQFLQCVADLDTCTADLSTCDADLGTCTTDLGVCEADLAACEAQPPAPVPQTGQMTCWNSVGTEIDCAGTGQDGDIQAGVPWPSPRFIDLGDGTIKDNLTGLVWLTDANCLGGSTNWQDALNFANGLYDGCPDCGGQDNDCGLSDGSVEGDWHLPNRNELTSLLDLEKFNPALPTGHPFVNFQSGGFWSSTTNAFGTSDAWLVDFIGGNVVSLGKAGNSFFVLPVRGGS